NVLAKRRRIVQTETRTGTVIAHVLQNPALSAPPCVRPEHAAVDPDRRHGESAAANSAVGDARPAHPGGDRKSDPAAGTLVGRFGGSAAVLHLPQPGHTDSGPQRGPPTWVRRRRRQPASPTGAHLRPPRP